MTMRDRCTMKKLGDEMTKALVVSDFSLLGQTSVRANVIRIPEVLGRFREVQKEIDAQGSPLDLVSYFLSDSQTIQHTPRYFSLARLAVILGLIDRLEKTSTFPGVVVVNQRVLDLMAMRNQPAQLKEAVGKALALVPHLSAVPTVLEKPTSPVPSYQVWSREGAAWNLIFEETSSLSLVIKEVADRLAVKQFLTIGCYDMDLWSEFRDMDLDGVQLIDVVERDPLLQWFIDETPMRIATA